MASTKKLPRLVAVPLAAIGHVTAMMHVCSYLNSKYGIPITMVTIVAGAAFNLKEKIEQRGTWPPPGSDISVVQLECDVPDSPIPTSVKGRMNLTGLHLRARDNASALERLVSEIEEGVAAIISEYQYSWVMDVANKLGTPCAILFTGSATWSWFDINMPFLLSKDLVPMQDDLLNEDEDTLVSESPPLWRSDIPWHFWNDKSFQDFTLEYNVSTWDRATWILVNTAEVLEERMLNYMVQKFGATKYLAVGPLCVLNREPFSVGVNALDRSWISWLDEQVSDSVLYIAFGSVSSLPAEQVDDFVLGLDASQQKFLWVLSSPYPFSDCLQQFVERAKAKGRGMVVPWAPQQEILSHRAIAAFVSHCGWNSTTEAVSSGKPIVCWPCLFEQNKNARMLVEDWKVGTWMTKRAGANLAGKEEVERVIRRVMEGDEGKQMRASAEMLGHRLLEAVTENGPSTQRFNAFVEELLQRSKSPV